MLSDAARVPQIGLSVEALDQLTDDARVAAGLL